MTTKLRAARRMNAVPSSKMTSMLGEAKRLQSSGTKVIDLALGSPDYQAPAWLLQLAQEKIAAGLNSYGDSKGSIKLRTAVRCHLREHQDLNYDPDTEVTVTAGASAALTVVMQALLNPGDGVIVFEPFYENFLPMLHFAGLRPQFVRLNQANWSIDFEKLKKRVRSNTRAILLNSPHNPTGRVFSKHELRRLAEFCREHDLLVISDEAYAPFTYGEPHQSIATLAGMKERTVIISSISKILNVAGWRVGSIVAPAVLSDALRRANALTLGAPTPLQEACAEAIPYLDAFCQEQRRIYLQSQCDLESALLSAGVDVRRAEGSFALLADVSSFGYSTGNEAQKALLQRTGILTVSGDSFFSKKAPAPFLRFCFARSPQTIRAAVNQLRQMR